MTNTRILSDNISGIITHVRSINNIDGHKIRVPFFSVNQFLDFHVLEVASPELVLSKEKNIFILQK